MNSTESSAKGLKVALIQQSCLQQTSVLNRSLEMIAQAAQAGAELVVMQELHAGHYFCQQADISNFKYAESLEGRTASLLAEAAQKWGIVLIGSIFERRQAGIYHNTAVVFERDGSRAGIYRKMHIPDDPGYYEKFYFTPGDLGFKPIETSVGRLGVLICWDQWFPEAARLMTLAGAELLIYPTAIGWDDKDTNEERMRQLDAWLTIQRAHAIANGLPVLAVNRVGFEQDPADDRFGIRFWGNSFVCGPQGELLAQASAYDEEILYAVIDKDRSERVRCLWPFLRDRRVESYNGLLKQSLR